VHLQRGLKLLTPCRISMLVSAVTVIPWEGSVRSGGILKAAVAGCRSPVRILPAPVISLRYMMLPHPRYGLLPTAPTITLSSAFVCLFWGLLSSSGVLSAVGRRALSIAHCPLSLRAVRRSDLSSFRHFLLSFPNLHPQ
jgi:hypothetical protein